MTGDWPLTRRAAARLLAGWAAALGSGLAAAAAGPRDRGIGGTGVGAPTDPDDRGIGGTGVIGTIQRFGSIVVNDLRIAYPDTATVTIDGRPAAIGDLRIGQVVRVAASRRDGRLSTALIDVVSEAAGPIERLSPTLLRVLGQSVLIGGVENGARWRVGDAIAVSGLRRPDGIIVASLLEARPEGPMRVAGPVARAADGRMTIGDLTLSGIDPSFVGRRATLEGYLADGAFQVTGAESEGALIGARVRRLSVEAYVSRGAGGLRLGSGLQVVGGKGAIPAPGGVARAFVDLVVDRDGRLIVDDVRPDRVMRPGGGGSAGTGGPGGPGGPGPGGPGPGGPGPGGPGPGGQGPGGPGPGGPGPGGPGPGGPGPGGPGPGGPGPGGGPGGPHGFGAHA